MTERNHSKLKFVGLHAHCCVGSPFDALGYPSEHMDYAFENGMDAMALTDHGNMNGFSWQLEHAKKMKREGKRFKPIFGCEAYYIPDILEWRKEHEAAKEEKKERKKKIAKGLSIEDSEGGRKLVRNSHFLLLAKNQKGLNNLFHLVSESYKDGNRFMKPRIDLNLLRKYREGLIATTTCISGPFAKVVWQNPHLTHPELLQLMRPLIEEFLEVFGDDYYCELQWNNIPEQHKLNHCIIDLSKQYNIKLISTVDSHYARPDLWKERELYKRLGWLGKSNRPDWLSDELPESVDDIGYELYPKNGDQVYDSFVKYSEESGFGGFGYDPQDVIESIENTYEIAHGEIEDFDPDATVRLPSFVVPIGKTEDQALKDMCMEGLRERGIYQRGKYKERILTELEVISARGFSKYFLAMKAISDKAQENYLCSPGRGSAAGSLISYALGITQVDSIKWELLFSRFLRKDATDYPDIDFDVSEPMLLKEQLIQEWGDNVVVPISNWNTLQLRSLIKDISKFYNIPFTEVNSVTRVMIDEATPKAKAERGIKSGMYTPNFEELMRYSKSLSKFFEEYPHVKTYVEKLHGEVRSCSRHAGGVVVGEDLDKHMPLIYNGGVRQTPWSEGQNVRHLEPLGFIKFDILGLASVKMIENCIKNILMRKGLKVPTFRDVKSFYDKNLHPDRINLKDYDVYENIFHEGNWAGCFQFTEEGAQKFCQEVKPTSIIDISVVTSIYRPGPLGAGVHQQYVDAKNGMKHVEYIHPIHKKITQDTFGFLIFQEQIALLAHQLGDNISLDEGNKLRKLLTKKGGGKGEAEKQKIYKKFIKGCTDKRIPTREAEGLWSKFEYFSGYGFNKSHAVSYSLLSYQCAYLYHYYPVEWMAAFLDKEPESRKEKTVSIAKGAGFDIKPVDINESGKDWGIKGDKVLVQPLSAIKGLGDKAIEQILLNRPFGSVEELIFNEEIKYNKLNKRSLDVLCRSGALRGLEDSRFRGGKHFWSSVAVDRPKSLKKFLENIEKYEHEGEFSRLEKIEYMVGLTGMYPFDMVISDGTIEALKQRDIPPLSEYNKEIHEMAWVIPRKKIVKETKKGNPYWILECIDLGGKTKINCWGVDEKKDSVVLNQPYLIKINHDDWGFSTKSISKNFRILS